MIEKNSERRKFQRAIIHVPVKYRKINDPAGTLRFGTLSKNLSAGGVQFRTKDFLSKACKLVMELNVPMTKPVKAISKVAWIRKTASSDDYIVGNQFLEMSNSDRRLVSEYIDGIVGQKEQLAS